MLSALGLTGQLLDEIHSPPFINTFEGRPEADDALWSWPQAGFRHAELLRWAYTPGWTQSTTSELSQDGLATVCGRDLSSNSRPCGLR